MKKKNVLLALSILFLTATFISCKKLKKDCKKESTYYSTDYKLSEGKILNRDILSINYLSIVFIKANQTLKYKLVAKTTDNGSEGGLKKEYTVYEEGVALVTDDLKVTFQPTASADAYPGAFQKNKKSLTIQLPGTSQRATTFQFKQ